LVFEIQWLDILLFTESKENGLSVSV